MCGLFIRQNIAMESEHNTKLFIKKMMTNTWKYFVHVSYIKICMIVKDVLCLLFFKDERYVEKYG